jgi:hypothetical protein
LDGFLFGYVHETIRVYFEVADVRFYAFDREFEQLEDHFFRGLHFLVEHFLLVLQQLCDQVVVCFSEEQGVIHKKHYEILICELDCLNNFFGLKLAVNLAAWSDLYVEAINLLGGGVVQSVVIKRYHTVIFYGEFSRLVIVPVCG